MRCQIAVVVLDEDGNEVATMWPFNADASQWVTSCKVALTQEECDNMVKMGIEELQKLKALWESSALQHAFIELAATASAFNGASPSPAAPCSEPAPDADAPRE